MKNRILPALLAAMITALAGTAAADSWNGTAAPADITPVTAPAEGLLEELNLLEGETAEAGETVGNIRLEKVFATFDGTVAALAVLEGETADGTVLEIAPESLYTLVCTVDSVAQTPETALIHAGERMYVRCTADGTHRAEAVVTAVNGAEFTAETTAGELYVGEAVWLYRDEEARIRVGKGTVTVHETVTVASRGTIRNLRVQAGDTVERGQWLYSVASGEETEIILPVSGIVTEVKAGAGEKVAADQELAAVAAGCVLQIRVSSEEVTRFRTGMTCRYFRGDDPHETAYKCTVERILLEEGQTEAVVELRPEEGTLLPLGLSVRVETDG